MNIEALAREAGLMRPQMIGPELERFAALYHEAVVQELMAGSGEPEAVTMPHSIPYYTADQLAGAVARERERCAKAGKDAVAYRPDLSALIDAAIRGQT